MNYLKSTTTKNMLKIRLKYWSKNPAEYLRLMRVFQSDLELQKDLIDKQIKVVKNIIKIDLKNFNTREEKIDV